MVTGKDFAHGLKIRTKSHDARFVCGSKKFSVCGKCSADEKIQDFL